MVRSRLTVSSASRVHAILLVLDTLLARYAATKPEYDFVAPDDGFRHQFWVITDEADIKTVTEEFKKMPSLYIADGHHRSAAAALVGAEKAKNNPNHKGDEEYNICFGCVPTQISSQILSPASQ